jgi:hypothetical protein
MTEYSARLFTTDAEIEHLGEGLLARAATREEWTHEAHLAATAYLLLRRPDIDLDAELPGIIRRFNESVGGTNDETQGYHETITQCFLRGVRRYLGRADPALPLAGKANGLLVAPEGQRDWPLRFYSPERLFSVEARLGVIAPDLAPLPASNERAGSLLR